MHNVRIPLSDKAPREYNLDYKFMMTIIIVYVEKVKKYVKPHLLCSGYMQ